MLHVHGRLLRSNTRATANATTGLTPPTQSQRLQRRYVEFSPRGGPNAIAVWAVGENRLENGSAGGGWVAMSRVPVRVLGPWEVEERLPLA